MRSKVSWSTYKYSPRYNEAPPSFLPWPLLVRIGCAQGGRTSMRSQVSWSTQALVRAPQLTQISRKPEKATVKPSASRFSTRAVTMTQNPFSSQYLRNAGGASQKVWRPRRVANLWSVYLAVTTI